MNYDVKKDFDNYKKKISDEEKKQLKYFFSKIDECCELDDEVNSKIKEDFIKALLFYTNNGYTQKKSLELLDVKYLGDFYRQLPPKKFQLDDSGKILSFLVSYDFMSMFRISVYLKKEIVPELLQMALNFTIKRFPSFATKLKKNFLWHYLESTRKRYSIEYESNIPCQPINIKEKNHQLFRIIYYKNKISIEIFHGLTDGTGCIIFLKTLLAEYLRLTGIDISYDKFIFDINDVPDSMEFENSFINVPLTKKIYTPFEKKITKLNGKISKVIPCQIIHFKLNTSELKNLAKKNNTTVTGYMISVMFVCAKLIANKKNGNSSILVPVNIRNFYHSKTIHNFSLYFIISLSLKKIYNLPYTISMINHQLYEKNSKQNITEIVTKIKKMISFYRWVPLNIKRIGSKLYYKIMSGYTTSNVLSNLGVVELPHSISEHVESMDVILNTTISNKLICSMITVNNITTFSITKMTKDTSFEEKMYELLCNDGLIPIVEGSELYED